MTRKDYILIAKALRGVQQICTVCDQGPIYHLHAPSSDCKSCLFPNDHHVFTGRPTEGTIEAAENIAYALMKDNSRFNGEHFLAVVRGEKALESRPARR